MNDALDQPGAADRSAAESAAAPASVPAAAPDAAAAEVRVPSRAAQFLTVFPPIMLPMFLAVADQTIVATALPAIASDLGEIERVVVGRGVLPDRQHHRGSGLWPARRYVRPPR